MSHAFPTPPPRATNPLALLLACGALGAAVYIGIALYHGEAGHAAIPQPDTLIYQQYARAIAEGRPYRFMPDEAPTTGSTSHLLPWILAVFYKAGATGDALATAGLVFAGVCWMAFLALFWMAARRLAPESAPLAAALVVLSGHTLFAAFGQTDQGLFMALSAAALAAALYERHVLLALALAVAVWTRPEGVILSVALLAVALAPGLKGRRAPLLVAAIIGCVSFASQLAFHYWLTGSAMFHSLAGKEMGASAAMAAAAKTLLLNLSVFWREVFLGVAGEGRQFYALPVVGGLLGIVGLSALPRLAGARARVCLWWLLAAGGSIAVVATSPSPNLLHDRYLSWVLPFWTLCIAMGAREAGASLPWPRAGAALGAALIAWQAGGFVFFAAAYAEGCAATASNVRFVKRCNEILPAGSRVGFVGGTGYSYYLDRHTAANFYGVMSPDFIPDGDPMGNFEKLKHRPDLRFDAWLVGVGTTQDTRFSVFLGEQIIAEAPVFGAGRSMVLHKAVWDAYDGADRPLSPDALQAVEGMRLVARLDVGHGEDERRAGYSVFTRIPGAKILHFLAHYEVGGRRVADVGRVIYGTESFRAPVQPGAPLRMVFRTASAALAPAAGQPRNFLFGSPLTLRVVVNGRDLEPFVVAIPEAEDAFRDVVLDIPGAVLDTDIVEFLIGGDRISFAWWLYQ